MDLHRSLYRCLRVPPRVAYRIGLESLVGRMVLLLTTTGRKTGLPRTTPLQYEEINGDYYVAVASAHGCKADWFRNLRKDPTVRVKVGTREFTGAAEPITDTGRIADFLEVRLKRHPRIVGAIMRRAGLPSSPTRAQLEEYASRRAMVVIHPCEESDNPQQTAHRGSRSMT